MKRNPTTPGRLIESPQSCQPYYKIYNILCLSWALGFFLSIVRGNVHWDYPTLCLRSIVDMVLCCQRELGSEVIK
jgi:hypothetical protein